MPMDLMEGIKGGCSYSWNVNSKFDIFPELRMVLWMGFTVTREPPSIRKAF